MSAQKKKITGSKQHSPDTKKAEPSVSKTKIMAEQSAQFAFGRENYKWLIIGLAVIFLGFLLMIGGGSDDPNVFSDKIFSFRRLTLAPILILAGFIIEIYAIMKKSAD